MYYLYVEFTAPIDDYCEALSVSFGMRSSPAAGGAGRGAQAHDLSFSASQSSLTNKLFRHCILGTKFAKVWVERYRDDTLYLYYELADVYVMSMTTSNGTVSVSLDYGTMTYKYFQK